MSETQDQTDDVVENNSQDADEVSQKNVADEKLSALEDKVDRITGMLLQKNAPKETVPQQASFTAEQIQALQQNPALLAQFIEQQTNKSVSLIKNESAKSLWDSRAQEKFPLLKTDKDFQKKVGTRMSELKYDLGDDHPKLLYLATELAASEYKPKAQSQQSEKTREHQTSVEPSRSRTSRESQSGSKNYDNDPRLVFAKLAGGDSDPKKLEAFKKRLDELGPYQQTTRKVARRIG